MQRFKNILAHVSLELDEHPSLTRAARLAKQNDAKLTAISVIPRAIKPRLIVRRRWHGALSHDWPETDVVRLTAAIYREGTVVIPAFWMN
jgi:hypothetical protein